MPKNNSVQKEKLPAVI